MWGLCQNIEIIHQHHHHFYELILPNKSRNRSLLSKTQSLNETPSPEYIPASSHPSSLGTLKEPSTSTFYRSKRAYLSGTQRGIEVLSRRQDLSFQLSRINLQTAPTDQHQICPRKQGSYMPLTPRQTSQQIHQQIVNRTVINDDFTPVKKPNPNQISVTLDQSIQKSTPTVCRNPHQASLKASHYFNLHQLKQSTINFKNASVCETKKKHRENPLLTHHAISLSTPAENGTISKNYHHQSSEIYLRDKDSIATKKENGFLSAFKTEKMFDDAKSIVSMESLQNSQLNIDESIIISRTMDYFTNISSKKQLPHCCLYLAKDNRISWLVSVREFEFKHEEAAMKEAKLHGLFSHSSQEEREWPVLALYRVMMEGSGLSKSIFFIQEPFESLLNEHIHSKKTYYKAVPSAFNHFLHDLTEQTLKTLSLLAEKRLFLMQNLQTGDFTMVNGMFKLHSLCKFQLAGLEQEQSRLEMLGYVQKLKSAIIQTVIFS